MKSKKLFRLPFPKPSQFFAIFSLCIVIVALPAVLIFSQGVTNIEQHAASEHCSITGSVDPTAGTPDKTKFNIHAIVICPTSHTGLSLGCYFGNTVPNGTYVWWSTASKPATSLTLSAGSLITTHNFFINNNRIYVACTAYGDNKLLFARPIGSVTSSETGKTFATCDNKGIGVCTSAASCPNDMTQTYYSTAGNQSNTCGKYAAQYGVQNGVDVQCCTPRKQEAYTCDNGNGVCVSDSVTCPSSKPHQLLDNNSKLQGYCALKYNDLTHKCCTP